MNKLQTKQATISSLEVAEMLEMRHQKLLEKLEGTKDGKVKGIISILGEHNFVLSDYFIKDSYLTSQNKEMPCYQFTKLGCDFIANKFTGEKGIIFTAKYVKRFNEMTNYIKEQKPQNADDKSKLTEAKLINAKVRLSSQLLKLSNVETLSKEYKNILVAKATEVLTGEQLVPLPNAKQKTYSATDIANLFRVSANKIGALANKNNLKTEQYGEFYRDKSPYSSKEVDSFRYFDSAIPEFEKILGAEVKI